MGSIYWPDAYLQKRREAEEAIALLRPGQRVFLGSSCGEPQSLVKTLFKRCSVFSDLEIVRLMSLESIPLCIRAQESESISIRTFYLGSAKTSSLDENKRFIVPINLSSIPRLFLTRRLPIHVALIQVSPPDDFGWMSLGISVDITLAAAHSADMVIAQVNSRMPRVLGHSFIHVNEVDIIVEHDEDLLTLNHVSTSPVTELIGQYAAKLIDNGSTLQISPGAAMESLLKSLSDKNDLGIHTHFLSDGIMNLVSQGVITNRFKEINQRQCVASAAIGSPNLYEFINDNPGVAFFPSDYVNNPSVIAQHSKMVSINDILTVDLTGQAAADALPVNHFTGISGIMDFIRGSRLAAKGKSILLLPSTCEQGTMSRIVPAIMDTAVVIPRGDIHYVVTEFGLVNLFGKTLEERAMALISIAHPDFRDELFRQAQKRGLIGPSRTIGDSLCGIYPLKLEEIRVVDGENVLFRPAKPIDLRLIQEHFYTLNNKDVMNRFLYQKSSFTQRDVASLCKVDYVKNLTIVAVIGEVGYEQIIAIGCYQLEQASNLAEVSFSVLKKWQKKGLGRIIQNKLAEAAREQGIQGLVAYLSPKNTSMIKLFNSLPYKVSSELEPHLVILKSFF
jgi:acyl-CoA hydrolase/L-amino acid N-acyltransferase YncA